MNATINNQIHTFISAGCKYLALENSVVAFHLHHCNNMFPGTKAKFPSKGSHTSVHLHYNFVKKTYLCNNVITSLHTLYCTIQYIVLYA
jgi:hypothetical protein